VREFAIQKRLKLLGGVQNLNRQIELDVAKGIGIIMVVWGHTNGPGSDLINQFHMPFFFFISGMLMNIKKELPFGKFVRRKISSLLYPFWFWNLLLYPIFFVLYYWGNFNITTGLAEISRIVLTIDKVPFLGPTWFLSSLFWINVVTKGILSIHINDFKRDIIYGFLSIAVCIIGFNYDLPYHWSRTLVCFIFFAFGYLYKKYIYTRIPDKIKRFVIWVLFLIFLLESRSNYVNMSKNRYSNRLLFIVGAFCMILFLLGISKFYLRDILLGKHFAWLGRNSIYILIWHMLLFRVVILIQIPIYHLPYTELFELLPTYSAANGWPLLYVLTGVYGSLAWGYITLRFPFTPKK